MAADFKMLMYFNAIYVKQNYFARVLDQLSISYKKGR